MNTTEAIANFKSLLGIMLEKHRADNCPTLPVERLEIQPSSKFARVVHGTSAYAFIALEDGENKQLGPYSAGQIFKPASWKAPARHARGSVFDENPIKCCGPYGVAYLR